MTFARTNTAGALLLAIAAACLPAPVKASPLFELLGDTVSPAGLQGRTTPGGASAAYFNPALLLEVEPGLTVGFVVLRQSISVSLAGRPSTDFAIPEGLENARSADGSRFENYPVATDLLQYGREKTAIQEAFRARPRQGAPTGRETHTYMAFGLNLHLFEKRLALGLTGLIPNGEFTKLRAFFNDEREQYFSNSLHPEMYGDRLTAISFALGAGVRLLDNLTLGAGATLSLAAEVVAPTYVTDTGALDQILIDLDSAVNIGIAPHFGVNYQPIAPLRLTLTAHAPKYVELGTSFTFLLANGIEQQAGVNFILDYMPWHFGLGGEYAVIQQPDLDVSLAATLVYARWSSYRDRHGDRPSQAYAWADTLSPTLGARARMGAAELAADVGYTPTPVPEQTGRTNYVDNDRLSSALTGKYSWELFGTTVSLGAQLQFHRLIARTQTKLPTPTRPDGEVIVPDLVRDELPDDAELSGVPIAEAAGLQTNNPGWPGFGSKGYLLSGSLFLEVLL